MQIDNQDIIRTARQLRDEENQQQHVSPWRHSKRSRIPAWLITLPAAAFIGFMFGIWTQAYTQDQAPLTALVDTVYIKVHEQHPRQDSVAQAIPAASAPVAKTPARSSARPSRRQPISGRPVADDHIRYDLLVKN